MHQRLIQIQYQSVFKTVSNFVVKVWFSRRQTVRPWVNVWRCNRVLQVVFFGEMESGTSAADCDGLVGVSEISMVLLGQKSCQLKLVQGN